MNMNVKDTETRNLFIRMMKAPLYASENRDAWEIFLKKRNLLAEVVDWLNLEIRCDEKDGYAFLAWRRSVDGEEERDAPRLVSRARLSEFSTYVLLELRDRLLKFERDGAYAGEPFHISEEDLEEIYAPFMKTANDETKRVKEAAARTAEIERMGFLKRSAGGDVYEVRRILKAVVDAEWVAEAMQAAASIREKTLEPLCGDEEANLVLKMRERPRRESEEI